MITKDLLNQFANIHVPAKHQTEFCLKNQHIHLDLSKHYLDKGALHTLTTWLEQQDIKAKIEALFDDNQLNYSEGRSVDHTQMRDPHKLNAPTNHSAHKQKAFAESFEAQKIRGLRGQAITDLLVIGIGGSHLGVQFVADALQDVSRKDVSLHFLTGTEPLVFDDLMKILNPETTLVFTSTKSFSTLETLTNLEYVKNHFKQGLSDADFAQLVDTQFFALTAHPEKAQQVGFDDKQIFSLTDNIGGRFSLWSAIGLPMRLMLGEQHYQALIDGAYSMDMHFKQQPLTHNMPVMLALLDCYYGNQMDIQQRAVVAYSQRLKLLVEHLQQLEMESDGKSIGADRQMVPCRTGLAVWGGVGSNSQHSFHQFFYQGTSCIPLDMLIIDQYSSHTYYDDLLKLQCRAQAKALWQGNDKAGTFEYVAGGKPSTIITLSQLTPSAIGELVAMYEHKVFMVGLLTGTNAFDQYGVELGKTMAKDMLSTITKPAS